MISVGVGLFVYNRPDHTREVLDGIRRNNAHKLFIFCDAPKSGILNSSILAVRELVRSVDWCETVITEHTVNHGTVGSLRYGFERMFADHPAIIYLEDDCVPRADYLEFMTQCLDYYQNDERVYQVNGYQLPIHARSHELDTYFSRVPMSWGPGLWRRSWDHYRMEVSDAPEFFASTKSAEIRTLLPHFEGSMREVNAGTRNSWVYRWCFIMNKNDGYCVAPYESLIRNIGCDGTGVNYVSGRVTQFDVEFHAKRSGFFGPNRHVRMSSAVNRDSFMDQETPYYYGKPRLLERLKRLIKSCLGMRV